MPSGWRRCTLIEPHADRPQPVTLGADKGYDTGDFVAGTAARSTVTPHVAQNTNGRRSAIDGRTTRHPGYAVSQRIRKRIEEAFGWAKTVAGLRKVAPSRPAQGRLAVHPRHGRLQPGPPAEAAGGDGVTPGFRPEPTAAAKNLPRGRMLRRRRR